MISLLAPSKSKRYTENIFPFASRSPSRMYQPIQSKSILQIFDAFPKQPIAKAATASDVIFRTMRKKL